MGDATKLGPRKCGYMHTGEAYGWTVLLLMKEFQITRIIADRGMVSILSKTCGRNGLFPPHDIKLLV